MISFTYNLRSIGAPQGGMQQRGPNKIFRGAPGQGMQMMRNFRR